MRTTVGGWKVMDEDSAVLVHEYSFGPGTANTLVFRIGDRQLAAVSPASRPREALFADLAPYGEVTALIAPNGFHHMGVREWLGRYPGAKCYAPASSIARLEKKCSAGSVFASLEQFPATEGVVLHTPPAAAMKSGDLIARVKTGQGWIWYSGDLFMNLEKVSGPLPMRIVFKLMGDGPGFRLIRLARLLYVKDREAVLAWLKNEISIAPPAGFVPGHGVPIMGPDVAQRARAAVDRGY